jgi:hypothetical protein
MAGPARPPAGPRPWLSPMRINEILTRGGLASSYVRRFRVAGPRGGLLDQVLVLTQMRGSS